MRSIIQQNVISFCKDRRKFIIFLVFAWVCGEELLLASSLNMCVFEYLLFVMGNHYYGIYVLLMSYMFFQFDIIKKETNSITIRMQSIKRKYLCQLMSVFLQTSIYIFQHIFLAFVIGGTKLKFVNVFQTRKIQGYYNDTLSFFYEYQKYFETPLLALIVVVIYFITGLTVIGILLYVIQQIWGSKITFICSGLLLFNVVLGFKLGIRGLAEVFFVNNYFILHHVLFRNGWVYTCVNLWILVVTLVVAYVVLKRKKANKIQTYDYAKVIFRKSYLISGLWIVMYVGLNIFSIQSGNQKICFTDGILSNLMGYSIDNFHLMEFLRYFLFYAIPLYQIGSFLEKERRMYHHHIAIRYQTRKEWKKLFDFHISKFIIVYTFLFNFILWILWKLDVWMKNKEQNYFQEFMAYTGINEEQLIFIIVLSVILKSLELIYYKNLLLLIHDICKNSVFSYIFTLFGFFLSLITNGWMVSYGKSSLFFLAENIKTRRIPDIIVSVIAVIFIKNGIVRWMRFGWRSRNEYSNRTKRCM